MQKSHSEHAERRIVRFLSGGKAGVRDAAVKGTVLLEEETRGTICVPEEALDRLQRAGIVARHDRTVVLAPEVHGVTPKVATRRGGEAIDLDVVKFAGADGAPDYALVNLSESPLGQLMRRKTKCGRPFLSQAEFTAGERLRADFTRGQIMPRLGANWEASVASRRRTDANGVAELTEAALAARQRVERAVNAVGPELSGVLIDICCFLKGLELVESERGWPVRSAKIVLKTALGVLSRHYEPQAPRRRTGGSIVHWGSEDYRPNIG